MRILKALFRAITTTIEAYGGYQHELLTPVHHTIQVNYGDSGEKRFDKINEALEFTSKISKQCWRATLSIDNEPFARSNQLPYSHKYTMDPVFPWVQIGSRMELNVTFTTKDSQRAFGI